MLPLTRSRNRSRFFGIPFSPSTLFEGGTVAGAWYDPSDLSTMFDTSAGTTPVAMPGQGAAVPVGLMLDKSAPVAATGNYSGFFSGYGANVADNAAFTLGSADFTIEFWVKASSVASRQYVFAQINNSGTTTTFSFGFEITAASKWLFLVASGSNTYNATSVASATTNWTHIAAVRNGNTLTLYVNGSADGTADVTGVTINDSSELLKFGDYATTGALPYTGYISNFRIVKGAAVYTGNFTPPTAPLTAISGTSFLTFQNNYFKDNSTSALAVNVTTASANLLNPFDATAARTVNNAIAFNNTTARPELRARVNLLVATATLSTQSVTTQATSYTLRFAGTGSITLSGTATGSYSAGTHTITCTAGTLTLTVSGTVTTADLRPANSGALLPAYQAVVDANTYDTAGFPLYLRFDGIDDGMYTPANLDLSATDKVGVFAGVRKLSGVAGVMSEFSADTQTNAGSFVLGGAFVSSTSYDVQVRGSARNARYYETYAAPVSNVLSSAITTVAADSAAAMQTRINGSANAGTSFLSAASTGNFGTYPLYIGSRGNSSLWFNGHLYSLAVVGSAVSAGNISAMENWVAGKTGIQI